MDIITFVFGIIVGIVVSIIVMIQREISTSIIISPELLEAYAEFKKRQEAA
jgi:MFS superfamily sulfate permease-like transporter